MSIDFSATQPGNTVSAGKPVDIQTLQKTFAAVLRSYGTEKGGSPTTVLLEILRPDPAGSASGEDRNQQRRDAQQRADRNDFTQIDRQQLDRAELRSRDMSADYRNRLDRQETLRSDYQKQVERRELRQASVTPTQAAPPLDAARPSEPLPNITPYPPQPSAVAAVPVSEVTGANHPGTPATIAASNSPASAVPAHLLMPVKTNTSAAMPNAPQPASLQAFTVFTPAGRLGQQQQGKSEEDEEEKEERAEGKPEKKKQPFAALEAIRAETARPIRRNRPQQSNPQPSGRPANGLEHQPVGDPPHEKTNLRESPHPRVQPGETEPNQTRRVKTLDELLSTPSQSIVLQEKIPQQKVTQQKGESPAPNPTQYLNRIAAACEAAGQFAPIRIKLNLDHLGTLTLRFYHKADRLALRFETPTRESAQFLQSNLEEFRMILSKRSLKMIDVEIMWEE